MSREYEFDQQKAFSIKPEHVAFETAKIMKMLIGTISVTPTDNATDRKGNDYIALLEHGAKAGINVKRRDRGCSAYWRNKREPELALEEWNVVPGSIGSHPGKIGWTLDDSCEANLVLFVFDQADYDKSFLLSFQHLRIAFKKCIAEWQKKYDSATQYNSCDRQNISWLAKCTFVPVSAVWKAMAECSVG